MLEALSYNDFLSIIRPLGLFVAGMVVYALFVFKFYKFLARKNFIELGLHKYSKGFKGTLQLVLHKILYMIETIFVTPILVFFWFFILSMFLLVLAKTHSTESLMLTSAALVAAVRITSYYNENLAQDLAKMVPFALLGVFITDLTFFSIQSALELLMQVPSLWITLVYYLVFIVLVEVILRILDTFSHLFRAEEKIKDKE